MTDYAAIVRKNLYLLDRVGAYEPADNPSFGNPPFDKASHRILITRLSPFRDVDRSLPHLFLFQEARRALPEGYVDMCFFPTWSERELFDRENVPYLLGAQSLRSVDEFDLVLISNAYTLELINLPLLLLRSQVPLMSSERGIRWPPMILGGSNALASQVLIGPDADSLVDGIFVGEGEGQTEELVRALVAGAGGKERRLHTAAEKIVGFWAAGAWRPVTQSVTCQPQADILPVTYPLLNTPEVHAASLPITFGCPAFCAFCFEGYERKPYRELPREELLKAAQKIKRSQGNEELNLYSFNFNTHSDVLHLLLDLHKLYDRVTFLSQRVDILQHTGYLLEAEVGAGKQSFTLGIEGISAQQRARLHKSLPTEDVFALLERLLSTRIRELKLFYLLTGHESDQDLGEFHEFVRQVKEMRQARNRGVRVIFSFGLLIRMPNTPLRYDRLFLDPDHWRPLIGQVKSTCETNGFEFRMAFEWDEYCTSQVLALGGYWLLEPIVDLAGEGFLFDGRLPEGYWGKLQQRLIEGGHWNEAFLGEKGPEAPFALDMVQSNIPASFLYQQYQRYREGEDIGYCLGGPEQDGTCLGCGACVTPEHRAAIVEHRTYLPEPGPYLSQLRDVVHRKRRLQPQYLHVRLAPWFAGLEPEFANAAVFRQLFACFPLQIENLLSVRESLFSVRSNEGFPMMGGETVVALRAWDIGELVEEVTHHLSETPQSGSPTDVQFLGWAPGFTPGTFSRLHLHLYLPKHSFLEPRRTLDEYLRRAYVPYSVRREADPEIDYSFDVPKKGLKKKALLGGWFVTTAEGFRAQLELGPKFDLLDFMGGFGHPGMYRQAGMIISDLEWS